MWIIILELKGYCVNIIEMEDKNIPITYETLFEFLRLERARTELQKLPENVLLDAKKLIEKESIELMHLDAESAKRKEVSLKNMIKIISELYERRERKIVSTALDKSRTKSAIIDFSKFQKSEQELFQEVLKILDKYREVSEVLLKIPEKEELKILEEKKEEQKPIIQEKEEEKMTMVMFISPFPLFLGPDLEQFGPFDENDIARLPTKVANLLVDKKRAVKINPSIS